MTRRYRSTPNPHLANRVLTIVPANLAPLVRNQLFRSFPTSILKRSRTQAHTQHNFGALLTHTITVPNAFPIMIYKNEGGRLVKCDDYHPDDHSDQASPLRVSIIFIEVPVQVSPMGAIIIGLLFQTTWARSCGTNRIVENEERKEVGIIIMWSGWSATFEANSLVPSSSSSPPPLQAHMRISNH